MFRQKSYEKNNSGCLYIVATPIGNLDDITYRALATLKEVDWIAAEDTRHTQKLLNHFDIHTPLISYHEHSRKEREEQLIEHLESGKSIALVSDAGLPAISDPGQELVVACIEKGITVIPIPGVNAALSGLVASGLSTETFIFVGFLPRENKRRVELLQQYKEEKHTLIFYEAPHRIGAMLQGLYETLGDRMAVIARELTKRHEEFIRGKLHELIELCKEDSLKGEMTVIVEGYAGQEIQDVVWWEGLSIPSHVELWIEKGLDPKEAIKKVAEERQNAKREIYNAYHKK